ncbi:MAG: anaerobic glycerol-3-phosphate dehydrogenase subunit B [Candidatus Thorarchaeota archaeon]|nr:MAG: anaerobic glycerol-3-phosphate dehydrogenase subunit B [Candidatus Thorarchaeota archaeon]
MDIETDLVVIGGGMAGLVAGSVAAEAGLDVVLLRKGHGATAQSSGAIDIIGYVPGATAYLMNPVEGLHALSAMCPFHPYSALGRSQEGVPSDPGRVVSRVHSSVQWLKDKSSGSCGALKGDLEENIQAVSLLGTSKPTCLIQETMWNDTPPSHDSVILFAGLRGLPDFNPSSAVKAFMANRPYGEEGPRKAVSCILDVSSSGKPFNLSQIEIAQFVDHDAGLSALANSIGGQVLKTGADYVAVPPILGVERARENRRQLEEMTGATVFELTAFPPSVPGLRLQTSLEAVFRKADGRLLAGHEATEVRQAGDLVQVIAARAPRRTIEIRSTAVVLASGKFLAGGLVGDERGVRESLMGLPIVDSDLIPTGDSRPQRLTGVIPLSPEGHPLFGVGLAFDSSFHPVAADGSPIAQNLFAAGSVLAGYNYAVEKSGLGVALATGFAAGANAAAYVKGVQ